MPEVDVAYTFYFNFQIHSTYMGCILEAYTYAHAWTSKMFYSTGTRKNLTVTSNVEGKIRSPIISSVVIFTANKS